MPYNPEHDRVDDPQPLMSFVANHPLATLVTHDADGFPQADLIPLLCVASENSQSGWALVGHVARANPLGRSGFHEGTSLAVFGPAEHYISPSWYPSKAEHHRVVPTWNYMVVHAWGQMQVHDDAKWVRGVVARLTSAMESGRENPWRMGQAPGEYLDNMLTQIVGIELPVERLEGRFKVSAARSESDRHGAREGVVREAHGRASHDLADAMGAVGDPDQQLLDSVAGAAGVADVVRVDDAGGVAK